MTLASPPPSASPSLLGMMRRRDQSGRARSGAGVPSTSMGGGADEEEEDEEEEEEEEEEEDNMLGNLLFGNLGDSGELDAEYMDQDALLALGSHFKDSAKALFSSGAQKQADEDFVDEKLDNAVDYEDFKDDELEDEPEAEMQTEQSKFYAQAALAVPAAQKVEDEDDYDAEEDSPEVAAPPSSLAVVHDHHQVNKGDLKVVVNSQPSAELPPIPTTTVSVSQPDVTELSTLTVASSDDEMELVPDDESGDDADMDLEAEEFSSEDGPRLPVLFVENGQEVPKFSDIFMPQRPFWVMNKRPIPKRSKGRLAKVEPSLLDDEADLFSAVPPNFEQWVARLQLEDDAEDSKDEADSAGHTKFLADQPLLDVSLTLNNVPQANFNPVHQLDWENDILWEAPGKEESSGKIITLEKFGERTGEPSRPREEIRHPQMLRLETIRSSSLTRSMDKLALDSYPRNMDLAGDAWLEDICWDAEDAKTLPRPKLIYDLMDHRMVFEVADPKELKYFREHVAAMLVSPAGKDKTAETPEPMLPNRFHMSNDKYYNVKKPAQKAKKRALHAKVAHSVPALKLQTMKPKLSNKDLTNFHRPKAMWFPHHNEVAARKQGELAFRGPMKVILKTLGGKGSKLLLEGSDTLETFRAKAVKKVTDMKASEKVKVIYLGKELEEKKTFAEQGVRPNSVLHLVRTKVYPWPKAHRPLDGNKPTRPPGAFKKKSELSAKDGRVALMEYCEERPLLLSNVGMGAVVTTYYRKRSPNDNTAATLKETRGPSVGAVTALEPNEESPFLGNILPGEPQSCIETSMYRAPAFEHRPATTDFLLVRSPRGKLSIRRIDRTHVVGQQEPHTEVMAPSSKGVLNYLGNRLQVYVYREFRAKEKPEAGAPPPQIGAEELMAQFPSLTETFIRKRLKGFADLQKGPNGDMRWVMRAGFRIPTEEEIRRLVSPENVCSYESMQAGLHHLKRVGVNKLTQAAGLSAAMNQLPDEALALAAASHIERELLLTPWNLSSNFVTASLQGRHGLERLEIIGAGDPTGRGLGFSYLRAAARPTNSGALVEKKAAAARGGGAVTGTDADLRRLSMDNAREVLLKFGVSEQEIEKLTRWHRIAMVRKLSSEHAASGAPLEATALNKYARGQRPPIHQHHQGRFKCQEIWDRQVQSLMAVEGDGYDSEGEGNGDLDDFAGDLENLLEVEAECDKDTSKKEKKETRGIGIKACRRAMQTQLEEELEDERAEAEELHRMLMEDDEEDEKKKKATASSNQAVVPVVPVSNGIPPATPGAPAAAPNLVLGADGVERPKKKRKVIKRICKRTLPNGTVVEDVVLIRDPVKIQEYLAQKEREKAKLSQKVSNDKGAKAIGKVVKVKKPTTILNNTPNSKLAKQEKDPQRLICGACGQLGHMRTNKKKCPRYQEEANGGPAEDKPLPKLIVKKNDSSANKVPNHVKKVGGGIALHPQRKIKLKLAPSSFPPDSGLGSAKSSSNNAPTPPPPPPPARPEPTKPAPTNGHGSVKLRLIVRPSVDAEALKQQLELEREKTKLELEEKERREREREEERQRERQRLEREREEREEAARREWERTQMELERRRQMEREKEARRQELAEMEHRENERKRQLEGQEAEKQRKKRKIKDPKKEKQKERRDIPPVQQEPPPRTTTGPTIKVTLKRRDPPTGLPEQEHPKRQRKRGGPVDLANIFESIIDQLKASECSYLFHKPVTKKDAPDYHRIISRPMDLSTMRDRARKFQYRNREDFMRDMQQIVDNAHRYNDNRNPGIPPLADTLLDICMELMENREMEISEAEDRMGGDEPPPPPPPAASSGRKRGPR